MAAILASGRRIITSAATALYTPMAQRSPPAAYNTIVDQELREIWEVRYWRHLLENFILWEDRE